jgi:esterase/lipase superfamily enzyme
MNQLGLRAFAALFITLSMAACAGHKNMSFADTSAFNTETQSIYAVTNRAAAESIEIFSGGRGAALSYDSYAVSIPPSHKPGKVEWAKGKPDPKINFVTAGRATYSSTAEFKAAVNGALAGMPASEREAVVFIHGYNTSYSESIYRLAQIKHDFKVKGLAIDYSWPSAAKTRYYVYDRDSIALSRDGLQSLLESLADTNVSKITLVGHSMGTYLTVETLRQLSMLKVRKVQNKLGPVILMSPDIDVDVFKSQVQRIDPMPKPFIIFTSSKDKALRLSALLTGQKERLGSLSELSEIGDDKITVVDVSKFSGGDKLDHFAVATSPTLITLINGILANGGGAFLEPSPDINPITAPVHIIQNVTSIILSPLEQ